MSEHAKVISWLGTPIVNVTPKLAPQPLVDADELATVVVSLVAEIERLRDTVKRQLTLTFGGMGRLPFDDDGV